MKNRIAALPCWKGKVAPVEVKGGHTNHNFMVEDKGELFFIRLGDDLPVHCVMRFNELAVSKAAYAAGISPEVIWHEPGVMVTRYIQGKTLTNLDIAKPAVLNRLIPLIHKCHVEVVKYLRGPVVMFWVFHICRNYAAILKQKPHPIQSELSRLMDINQILEKAVGDIKPCITHNDLLAANFIDDGKQFWIIDWEYSGFNSPLFDLACFCSFCDLSSVQADQILAAYFETQVSDELRRRFIALQCSAELWTYLWSLVSEIHLPHDIDYAKIASRHWLNFEKLWYEFTET
jgi:thiamine kinase-like enzyme